MTRVDRLRARGQFIHSVQNKSIQVFGNTLTSFINLNLEKPQISSVYYSLILCHDLEKFQGIKFFYLHEPNTLTTFKVHGISSQNCLTLNSIGFSNAISCSTGSDELVNHQNSSDI